MSASNYRGDIDGLRAVAVCLVIAYHASPRHLTGGFIGVDVFFVLSGYLISGLLIRELETTGRLSLVGFYARRARRLLPVSTLVLVATILGCAVFLPPLREFELGTSARQTALYVSNFWFLHQSLDYFAPGIRTNPFLHTWSLAVEEQFYLVWPFVVWLAMRGRQRLRTLLVVMALVAAGSFAACVWLTNALQPWAFFGSPARGWEFALGGIALLLFRSEGASGDWHGRSRALASWLGLGVILGGAAWLQGEAGFPGWRALVPVTGTIAILAGAPRIGAARILDRSIPRALGRLSYAWYLWHWPVLVFARAVHPPMTSYATTVEALACVFGSLGLAAATHVLVETPVRYNRYLAPRRRLALSLAGGLTIVSFGAAIFWQESVAETAALLEQRTATSQGPDHQAALEPCEPPGFLGTDVVECQRGDTSGHVSVVLFGDSHAGQWVPALARIAIARGWRLTLIDKAACPSAEVTIFNSYLERTYTECDAWRTAALTRIVTMRPDAVIVTNRQVQNFWPGVKGRDDTWRLGLRHTLTALDSAGITTIVLRDSPMPAANVEDCLAGDVSWWERRHASTKRVSPCSRDRTAALDDGILHAEQAATEGLPHVRFLDLSDQFCDAATCEAIKNGLTVYTDSGHVTGAFTETLAPGLATRLVPLMSGAADDPPPGRRLETPPIRSSRLRRSGEAIDQDA